MTQHLRLRHLEVFLAVAQAGSMQRAAHIAHLTQPAISKLIHELEAMFGVALMDRSKRGIALTECGLALQDRARVMLNDLSTTADELAAIARGLSGKVRVGALPVVETVILPATLLALRKTAPGLSIQIEEGTRAVLINALRRGEVDCVLGRLDDEDERHFHVETLQPMPVMLVANPRHPLTRQSRVTWQDLTRYPWILAQANAPIRVVIESQFIRAGIRPPAPVIESTSSRLNCGIVAATDMITVMTEDAAIGYVRAGMVAILPVDVIDLLPMVGFITRTPHLSPAVRTFLTALRQECAKPSPTTLANPVPKASAKAGSKSGGKPGTGASTRPRSR
ncbi:MAG: LysR family transcriptional regulator [Rhodopseudomonas sp.]|nr:LysR family transcriptional regulator [Rhodopseudomonas sp.]